MQQLGGLLRVTDRGGRAMRARRPVSRNQYERTADRIAAPAGSVELQPDPGCVAVSVTREHADDLRGCSGGIDTGEGAWHASRELLRSPRAFNGEHRHPAAEGHEVRAMHPAVAGSRPEFNSGVGSSWSISDAGIAERLNPPAPSVICWAVDVGRDRSTIHPRPHTADAGEPSAKPSGADRKNRGGEVPQW